MKVRYTGHKKSCPIELPIGAKSKGTIKKIVIANPFAELEDEDARKLVEINSHFEIVLDGTEIHQDVPVIPKKRGRPAKVANAN